MLTSPLQFKIFAVVVTYQPEPSLLLKLLHSLATQVAGGIIINNGSSLPISGLVVEQAGFAVMHQQTNTGVATALNAGYQWSFAQGAEFVISFDQDSEPFGDMVASLLQAYQALSAAGYKVGAIGPQQIDRRSGHPAPFLAPISGLRRKVRPAAWQTVEVDHLITSGCLVHKDAWKDAGAFLDELFIDYVDIEWSLRLRHRGWHLFGVGGAKLTHAIGDDVTPWRGRQIPHHTPLRHYYMFRNGIYLQKMPHISFGWKLADGLQLLKKMIFFTVVGHSRWTQLRAILSGVRDGWRGHMGAAHDTHEN